MKRLPLLLLPLLALAGCDNQPSTQAIPEVSDANCTLEVINQIEDRTGKLWVVSNRGVPRKGAQVSVKGTVREGFSLGSIGDKVKLPPAVSAGIVLMETSHEAK